LLVVSFYSPLLGDRAITIFVRERSVHGGETAPLVTTSEEKRVCVYQSKLVGYQMPMCFNLFKKSFGIGVLFSEGEGEHAS